MFLIVYSGQRYKIKIRKTNLRTIIFGWERGLGGDGEKGRESWGGRQGQPRSKPTRQCLVEQGPLGTDRGQVGTGGEGWLGTGAGAAGVEAYEALPRRTGTAGNGQGAVGDGGKTGWERRQGQVGTRERTAGDGLRPLSAIP